MHLVSNTDYYHGVLGGCMLGLSSSLFLLLTGQITGLSGIAEGLVSSKGEDWHGSYVLGLCLSGTTMSLLFKDRSNFDDYTSMLSTEMIVVAGLLTGFGTRLGSGCTSGHGLCGLPRRSLRSLVAVATFMSTGAITAYICNLPAVRPSLISPHTGTLPRHQYLQPGTSIAVIAMIAGRYLNLFDAISSKDPSQGKAMRSSLSVHAASLLCGFSFGVGLIVSGMCSPNRVIRFLDFSSSEGWDPTLISVLMSGVLINSVSFHVFKYWSKLQVVCEPRRDLGASLHMGLVRPNLEINWRLLLGSALFGVGWGIAGICPGPGLVSLGALSEGATVFMPSVFIGMVMKQCCIT